MRALLLAMLVAAATGASAEGPPQVSFEGEIGLGYDTNPFLAPDEPYFDQNSRRIIEPVKQPGWFVPIGLDGGLIVPLGRRGHRFVTGYRAKGNFYTDDANDGADEVWIKVDPGFVFDLGFASERTRFVDVRAFGSYNRELYFDRDTGLPAVSSGFDVSDRYNYRAAGLDLHFDYELTKAFRLYLEGRAEHRNYDDPGVVEAFDHDRIGAELGTVVRLSPKFRLYLSYGHQIREYSQRSARLPDGDNPADNPRLRYEMDTIGTELRYRPLRPWRLELTYQYTTRTDTFLHYNDYVQNMVRLRSTVDKGRTRWRITLKRWTRDFENAFIFDKPVDPSTGLLNPKKDFDSLDAMFEGYFPLRGRLRLWFQLRYRSEDATDPRFAYDRSRVMAGLEWSR